MLRGTGYKAEGAWGQGGPASEAGTHGWNGPGQSYSRAAWIGEWAFGDKGLNATAAADERMSPYIVPL